MPIDHREWCDRLLAAQEKGEEVVRLPDGEVERIGDMAQWVMELVGRNALDCELSEVEKTRVRHLATVEIYTQAEAIIDANSPKFKHSVALVAQNLRTKIQLLVTYGLGSSEVARLVAKAKKSLNIDLELIN